MKNFFKIIALIFLVLSVSSCTSISRGITEAIINQEDVDNRKCEIKGSPFYGVNKNLEKQKIDGKKTKILMVHGVGDHIPGHSTKLSDNLMQELGMNVMQEKYKDITIMASKELDPLDDTKLPLANLRITRHLNKERNKEILFYEITWSPITIPEKELIAFDSSGEYSFKRAGLNQLMKEFFNENITDPMIYLGPKRDKIRSAVTQSICVMLSNDWADLNDGEEVTCNPFTMKVKKVKDDNLIFLTHSLGSRIAVDTAQFILEKALASKTAGNQQVVSILRNKTIPIYMLANQLPLLQVGQDNPKITNQINDYCKQDGTKYNDKLLEQLLIIAFTDPNDILSYAIPPKFAEKSLDSRLCPKVLNVNLNVAKVTSIPGLGTVANPADAHNNYEADERVLKIIANGIGTDSTDELVKSKCKWVEMISD